MRALIREHFPHIDPADIERNGTTYGTNDKGDIRGLASWVVEAKNEKTISLAGYMREVETERLNAGTPYGVALVKARGKSTIDGYAVMPIGIWLRVAARLDELERAIG